MIDIGGFRVSGDVVVLGAIDGMLYGVLAVGLILVYRMNRIINFAHGQIGALGAAVLGVFVLHWGVPYWMAFPLALLASAAVGAASEVVVVRRLRSAPLVITLVATLGLSQLFLLIAQVITGKVSSGASFPQPPGLPSFNLGALRVTPAYTAMLIISPLIVAGIAVFLRRGRLGLEMRAAAANPEAATMAGVLAPRMSMLAWSLAGGLAAYTAILVLPSQGFSGGEFLGTGLLLRAMAAAVVGRMTNLPVALMAGVGVGVIEQVLLANSPTGGFVELALFAIILISLLLQRAQTGRREDKGSWAAVRPFQPLPESYQQVFAIRHIGRIVFAIFVAIALLLGSVLPNSGEVVLVAILATALVGLSVGIVTGLAGQLSLGQFAFAGVGAAVSIHVTAATHSFTLGFTAAGVVAAGTSVLVGVPALRVQGLMLAVTTLAFALACQSWLFQQNWMLGQGKTPRTPRLFGHSLDTGRSYFFFGLVVFVFGLAAAHNIWRSGLGRQLRAVRDNQDAARAFTVPAARVKVQSFVIGGFLAGLGGALYAHSLAAVTSSAFPIDASIDAAAVCVIGGIGLLAGPLLGSLYIIGVPQWLPLDNAGLAATSLGWLTVVLQNPGGFAQALAAPRDQLVDALAARAGLDPQAERASARSATREAGEIQSVGIHGNKPRSHQTGPVLQASRLTKSFGGVRAVQGVDLEVSANETHGLIGPNGAGKTTLFEMLSGFTRPDSGSVEYLGRDISALSPEQRGRQGLIRSFQDAALFPTMTVLETLQLSQERLDRTRLGAAVLGWHAAERRKEKRARDLLSTMGLYGYRNRQIRELSTGTRRITELACLVMLEPQVLLLDEPSSGIAQRETEALGGVLMRIKADLGLSLVIIEHDIPLVMSICDRITAMESGQVLITGSPAQVRSDPRVVSSYLGSDITAIERSTAAASL